jgi:hypothetical protein
VAGDAVADSAKARKIDEKSFFENRWQGVIKIGGLSKSPQSFGDLRSLGRKSEEVRKHAKPLIDVPL